MQVSEGTKICMHIDYEMGIAEGLGHQAIVRSLSKTWSMKSTEVEVIIKEQEAFLEEFGNKGVLA